MATTLLHRDGSSSVQRPFNICIVFNKEASLSITNIINVNKVIYLTEQEGAFLHIRVKRSNCRTILVSEHNSINIKTKKLF